MERQADTYALDLGPTQRPLDAFVARARALTDDDRLAVAEARRGVGEAFRDSALRAASEALVGRGETYAKARRALGTAHVPDSLEAATGRDEVDRWTEVARLVQLSIDEALVALVATDVLHPNHLRELYRPWWALDAPGGQDSVSSASTSSP